MSSVPKRAGAIPAIVLAVAFIGCRLTPVSAPDLSDNRTWLSIESGSSKAASESDAFTKNAEAIRSARELRADLARKIWNALLAENPPYFEPYVNLARLERLHGGNPRAPLELLCSNKTISDTEFARGFARLQRDGRTGEALEFAAVIQGCKRAPRELLLSVGETQILRGSYRAALDALDGVLVTEPNHERALFLTGLIFAEAQDWPRARSALEAAVRAKGTDPRLRTTLAHVYLKNLMPQEALAILAQPDRGADADTVLELSIRAIALIDWGADTRALFAAFRSKERGAQLRQELYAGEDQRLIRAAETELRDLY